MRIVPVIVEAIVKGLRYAPRAAEDHRQAFREHSAILGAIREKSPEKAFQAMQQHLEASYRRTISIGRRR
jgi:DNA-binding FadR family transcriptional regulator